MTDDALEESRKQAESALGRLEEAIGSAIPKDELMRQLRRDAIIQRFEFSYERLWKYFRRLHQQRGVDGATLRRAYEVIAEAGAAGWLKDRAVWEQMIRDRNLSSHEYTQNQTDAIYERIVSEYASHMRDAFDKLDARYVKTNPFDKWKGEE